MTLRYRIQPEARNPAASTHVRIRLHGATAVSQDLLHSWLVMGVCDLQRFDLPDKVHCRPWSLSCRLNNFKISSTETCEKGTRWINWLSDA